MQNGENDGNIWKLDSEYPNHYICIFFQIKIDVCVHIGLTIDIILYI